MIAPECLTAPAPAASEAPFAVREYCLVVEDEQKISLPTMARPLSADFRSGVLFLWALVPTSPGVPKVEWTVRIADTDEPIAAWWFNAPFLGTLMCNGGQVLHVFASNAT